MDLATGSGVWGIVLAEHFPRARVTAVDFPAVLEVTKETAEKHGVADRFRFAGGDLLAADFGARHDLAMETRSHSKKSAAGSPKRDTTVLGYLMLQEFRR